MIKNAFYSRDYERWITPVYCQRGVNLLFHAFGTTKYESVSRAQLIQTAFDLAQEMRDLNQAQHDAKTYENRSPHFLHPSNGRYY